MRTIVIADCHGSPHLITNALEHANYQIGEDRLIFAGDFLDIGPDPRICWALLVMNHAEMLLGNHEVAILLKRFIGPQDEVSWSFYDDLVAMRSQFKVAAEQDGILITHAGLSVKYVDEFAGLAPKEIADELNKWDLDVLWDNNGPIWFRPKNKAQVYPIEQVCGHTPPEYLKPINILHMIDPYTKKGFDGKRYRYAVIEDGKVRVEDSNEKNDKNKSY